jgi:hypothetical protein
MALNTKNINNKQSSTTELHKLLTELDRTAGLLSWVKHVEPSKSVPHQDKKFIEITTVEEIREIDVCATKITTILQELEEQQENAFNEQKKLTKGYYDMFSKYEGSEQSSDWMRSSWFGLHFTAGDQWFNEHYSKDEDASRQCLPVEWKAKMRFGKPSTYAVTQEQLEELAIQQEEYVKRKEAWEAYVDSQWDTAYDDAFGVTAFLKFIRDIPDKINLDLYSITKRDIYKRWETLHHETSYFHKKISMYHIRIDGYTWSLMPPQAARTDSDVVTVFLDKVAELHRYVLCLYHLSQSGWKTYIHTDDEGKRGKIYRRYNHRTQQEIESYTPPHHVTPQNEVSLAHQAT